MIVHGSRNYSHSLTATDSPQKFRSDAKGARAVVTIDGLSEIADELVDCNVGFGEMVGSIVGMPTILHSVNV
jgi:hypothetical protein